MQRVKPCDLSSISQVINRNLIHPPKETNNFSLNQWREEDKASARSVNPITALTQYLLSEPMRQLPSRPTSPTIWPLISKS